MVVDFGDPAKGPYKLTLSQGDLTVTRMIPVESIAYAVSPQAIVQTEVAGMLREMVMHRMRADGTGVITFARHDQNGDD